MPLALFPVQREWSKDASWPPLSFHFDVNRNIQALSKYDFHPSSPNHRLISIALKLFMGCYSINCSFWIYRFFEIKVLAIFGYKLQCNNVDHGEFWEGNCAKGDGAVPLLGVSIGRSRRDKLLFLKKTLIKAAKTFHEMSLYNVMAERLIHKDLEKIVKISLPRFLKGGSVMVWEPIPVIFWFQHSSSSNLLYQHTRMFLASSFLSLRLWVCPNKIKWSFVLAWSFAGFWISTSNIHLLQASKNLPGIVPAGLQFEFCVSWTELFQSFLFLGVLSYY